MRAALLHVSRDILAVWLILHADAQIAAHCTFRAHLKALMGQSQCVLVLPVSVALLLAMPWK